MWGYDFLFYSGSWNKPDYVTESAINFVKNSKGLATFCFHWFSPKDWTGEIWRSFYSD
jgi:hypothetical protein